MAIVNGTNSGFVTTAPTSDPAGALNYATDVRVFAIKDDAPATAATITEIGWWCDNATEEANFEVGIYAHDSVNNRPDGLLAGASQTNAKGTGAGWKTATVNISVTAGTTYWIAYQLDDTATATNSDYTVDAAEQRDFKTVTTMPATWGVSDGTAGRIIPVYAVWTGVPPVAIKAVMRPGKYWGN